MFGKISEAELYAVGDSITAGLGSDYTVDEQLIFSSIFNYNRRAIVNRGVGHGRVILNAAPAWSLADVSIMNYPVKTSDQYIYLTGVNDMRDGVAHKSQYKAALRAALAWIGIPDKYKKNSRDTGASYAGVWSNETTYYGGSLSKYTIANGATVTIDISGTIILLCVSCYDGGGSFDVSIDGAAQTRIELDDSWGRYPKIISYSGLSNETHTVVLTSVSDSTQRCEFDWIGGLTGTETLPKIYVGNCIRLTATGYLAGGSDAAVAEYNVEILAACNEIIALGVDITHCDIDSSFNPNTAGQMQSNGIHPSTAGHLTIGNAFKTYL